MANDFQKFESRFVKSVDGTEIYTDAAGNRSPASPVVVLIHGGCMVKAAFDPMFEDPQWTSNVFLVRYDTRGHGRSGKPTTEKGWESRRISEDFEAVCKEFNVNRAFVLGWSVGATHFADILTYNSSVTILGLINVAGMVYNDPSIVERSFSPESLEITKRLIGPPSVDAFQKTVFDFLHTCSDKLSPGLFRALLEGILLQPRLVVMRLTSRSQNPEALLQETRKGILSMFILTGGKDKIANVAGLKTLIQELGWQKCAHVHLEEADHVPWVSCPGAFRDAVLGWLKNNRS